MSAYSDGTISLICGTNQILGLQTKFIKNVKPGFFMTVPGFPVAFKIDTVTNDTHLTITELVPGPIGNVVSGLIYYVVKDFTAVIGMPMPTGDNRNVQALINRAWNLLDREMPKVG